MIKWRCGLRIMSCLCLSDRVWINQSAWWSSKIKIPLTTQAGKGLIHFNPTNHPSNNSLIHFKSTTKSINQSINQSLTQSNQLPRRVILCKHWSNKFTSFKLTTQLNSNGGMSKVAHGVKVDRNRSEKQQIKPTTTKTNNKKLVRETKQSTSTSLDHDGRDGACWPW